MKNLLFIFSLIVVILTAGCLSQSSNSHYGCSAGYNPDISICCGSSLYLKTPGFQCSGEEYVNPISDDEYAVYSSFITQQFDNKSTIIILWDTGENDVANSASKYIGNKKSPILQNDTYSNFIVQNQVNARFRLSYNKLPTNVQLVNRSVINEIFSDSLDLRKQWDNFYKRFPNAQGITSISRVGFNSNKSQALLYASTMKGYLWGSGDIYVFSKINGNWSLSDNRNIWLS